MENLTRIRTTHEEEYSNNKKILGVLTNWDNNDTIIDSFTYIFHDDIYIFFNTIVELNDYLLYSDTKTKRAYMKEVVFDKLYDNSFVGTFDDQLVWTK